MASPWILAVATATLPRCSTQEEALALSGYPDVRRQHFFTGAWGQTPGKMVFGLTVARADGGLPTYGQAAWRWAASWVALGLLGVGLLMIAVTPRKRGLHDLLAGTVVLRQPPGSS